MVSHNQQVRAGKDYGAAKLLDTGCIKRLNIHEHQQQQQQCIFTNTSSGSSGLGTLGTVLAVAGLATVGLAAGASIFGAIKGAGGSQDGFSAGGAQGQGAAGTSKAVMGLLDNAEGSGDPKALQTAISQGEQSSKTLDQQIKGFQQTANKAKTDLNNVNDNIDTLKNATMPRLNDEMKGLKDQISGSQSSSGLTSARDKEIGQVPRTITTTDANGNAVTKPNPEYETDVNDIKAEYQPKIDKAKDIEDKQIPAKQKEIDEAKKKLEDFNKVKENTEKALSDANEQIEKLQSQQQPIDAKVTKLKQELANVQGATQANNGTKPSGATDTIKANVKASTATSNTTDDTNVDLPEINNSTSIDDTLKGVGSTSSSVASNDSDLDDLMANARTSAPAPVIADASTPEAAPIAAPASEETKPSEDTAIKPKTLASTAPKTDAPVAKTPTKTTTAETFSQNIKDAKNTRELAQLGDDIDERFGLNSKTGTQLHEEINTQKLALNGVNDNTVGSVPQTTTPIATPAPKVLAQKPAGGTQSSDYDDAASVSADRSKKIAELRQKYMDEKHYDFNRANTLATINVDKNS